MVDDKRGEGWVHGGRDGDLAKACKEHGGDAVVLANTSREFRGMANNGQANYRRITKVLIVKYLP